MKKNERGGRDWKDYRQGRGKEKKAGAKVKGEGTYKNKSVGMQSRRFGAKKSRGNAGILTTV